MVEYCITVRDKKSKLISQSKYKAASFAAVMGMIGVVAKTKKYKQYELLGYAISTHEMLDVRKHQHGAKYHHVCFLNLCIHFKLTAMEVVYIKLLISGVLRKDLIKAIRKELNIVVSIKTVKSHCLNLQNKTHSTCDNGSVSRFLA